MIHKGITFHIDALSCLPNKPFQQKNTSITFTGITYILQIERRRKTLISQQQDNGVKYVQLILHQNYIYSINAFTTHQGRVTRAGMSSSIEQDNKCLSHSLIWWLWSHQIKDTICWITVENISSMFSLYALSNITQSYLFPLQEYIIEVLLLLKLLVCLCVHRNALTILLDMTYLAIRLSADSFRAGFE